MGLNIPPEIHSAVGIGSLPSIQPMTLVSRSSLLTPIRLRVGLHQGRADTESLKVHVHIQQFLHDTDRSFRLATQDIVTHYREPGACVEEWIVNNSMLSTFASARGLWQNVVVCGPRLLHATDENIT